MKDLPAGQGGVVEDGTYWYTSSTVYNGSSGAPADLGGLSFGGTAALSGGLIHQSLGRKAKTGAATDTNAESGTFVTAGMSYTLALTCGDKIGTTKGTYTVSGKTLTLYFADVGAPAGTGTEFVLTKQ